CTMAVEISNLPSKTITLNGFAPQFTPSTNFEKLLPTTKITDTGHSACLLSDLTAHDSNWCIAATKLANTLVHVSFPTPADTNLKIGTNLQRIEAHFRQFFGNDSSAFPTARIELWESGSLIRAGNNTTVLPSGERVLILQFDAAELTDQTGAGVEVKTITISDKDLGFQGSVDTGFICFRSNSIVPDTVLLPRKIITLTAFVPLFIRTIVDTDISELPSKTITLTAYSPSFIVQGPRRISIVT
ncbi:hypothetical protein LCGC14_3007020, partial [marine sediment metagenome]